MCALCAKINNDFRLLTCVKLNLSNDTLYQTQTHRIPCKQQVSCWNKKYDNMQKEQ